MVSDIIQVDNNVELYLMRQIERERKKGEKAHVYRSQVTDIYGDGCVELSMPVESGKVILFPLRMRVFALFMTDSGVYRAAGIVEERYKSNNQYMMRIALKSQLYQYHIRTYCSLPCAINIEYFTITPEQALQAPALQLQTFLNTQGEGIVQKQGIATELCGAWVRFVTDVKNEANTYIFIHLRQNLIPAYVLSSEVSSTDSGRFENKAEFIWTDSRIQEDFNRYIFDERRKNRKKEV